MNWLGMVEEIIKVFGGLLTPLIALIAIYIAYQQHKTNRDKLRLDLFEKRYAIYKGIQKFLTLILRAGKTNYEELMQFNGETQDATFLFRDEIPAYIGDIYSKANDLIATTETYKPLPVGEDKSRLVKEATELTRWLTKQLPELKDVFAPYLKFEVWK